MRYLCLLVLCFVLSAYLAAQTTVSFENFNLPPNTFLNNAAPNAAFVSGPVALPNNYDPVWMSWTGWGISNRTDTLTPGFLNESSAIAGSGANGSPTYAVSYAFDGVTLRLLGPAAGSTVLGMYVTNNAYAYYSMRDGDAFAKKFGGITGNDPDFFLLTIKKYRNGVLGPDSVNFYLADYRSPNNSEDYIVKQWTYVNLSTLGEVDSLQFTLSSSDVGAFGMNTPAYFCIDEVSLQLSVSQQEVPLVPMAFDLWPNPASSRVMLNLPSDVRADDLRIEIFNALGHTVLISSQAPIFVDRLTPGLYYMRVQAGEAVGIRPFRVVR